MQLLVKNPPAWHSMPTEGAMEDDADRDGVALRDTGEGVVDLDTDGVGVVDLEKEVDGVVDREIGVRLGVGDNERDTGEADGVRDTEPETSMP
jgi:hypothetical protein